VLPGLPVPPLEGVKDGTCYGFNNLSLKGFKVKKEDITVKIAGIQATSFGNENDDDDSNDGSNDSNDGYSNSMPPPPPPASQTNQTDKPGE